MYNTSGLTWWELPEVPSNVVLDKGVGRLSIIKPYARTNEVTNPSFELATTGYTAGAGVLARSTEKQYHGAYSGKYTPSASTTDGFYYGTITTVTNEIRAVSCKFYGALGVKYKLSVATTGGVDLAVKPFVGTGRWQWVWVFWKETGGTSRRIYFTKNGSTSVAPFYVDGVQSEVCAVGEVFPTTYIDGSQKSLLGGGQFPPVYGWVGGPHVSQSYRTVQTRDGGRVVNLDLYRFVLTAITGMGLVSPTHLVASSPIIDGSLYQTSLVPSRQIKVTGRINSSSPGEYAFCCDGLADLFSLTASPTRQPLALIYQEYNDQGPVGETAKIIASYRSGLEQDNTNDVTEDITLQFTQWFPYITANDQGGTLSQSTAITVTNVGNLMYRDEDGDWSKLADFTAGNGVHDILQAPDGTYYVVGAFTTIGGVAANRIARYDPVTNTFSALSTGLNGVGRTLHLAADGKLWVGGDFTTAGGTTVNRITYWDGSAFNAIGGGTKGVNDSVYDIISDVAGTVYLTGLFTTAGGSAAVRIVRWTGSAFSTMSSGLTLGGVTIAGYALALGIDGTSVYVGGLFDEAGGKPTSNIAVWVDDTTGFLEMEGGVDGEVNAVAVAPNGDVYIGGIFDASDGGLTLTGIGRWNGVGWLQVGGGIDTAGRVNKIVFGSDGLMYVAGLIISVGGITVTDGIAVWNGSAWILPDLEMAGSPAVGGLVSGRRGELMVGYFDGTASNATAAAITTLTNEGSAPGVLTLTITGPTSSTTRLYRLQNYTTGTILSFNLTIFANEVVTFELGPDFIVVTSNIRGDLSSYVLPGSSQNFNLAKGANRIAFLGTGGTITAIVQWVRRVQSVKELSYGL